MDWLAELGRRLMMLVGRNQFECDLEEEMRLHRELRAQEHQNSGIFFWRSKSELRSFCLAAGFSFRRMPPEVDKINFAPGDNAHPDGQRSIRLRHPIESSQNPIFRFLGTPEKNKRHAVFDGGHSPAHDQIIKEVLEWLDRYQGPVK